MNELMKLNRRKESKKEIRMIEKKATKDRLREKAQTQKRGEGKNAVL